MNSIILYKSLIFVELMKNVFKRCNFLEMINYLICNLECPQWSSLGLKIRLNVFVMWMEESCLSDFKVSFQI